VGVVGLDHVQLAMPAGGEPVARAFYVDLLGLFEVPKPPHMAANGGCWFAVPGTPAGSVGQVHVGIDPDFRAAAKAHPGLAVDDLDALVARLAGAGSAFTPDTQIPHLRRGHVLDPFGNRVELIQWS